MSKTIYLYNDNIGKVELVDHMGSDLTVVNAARVSLGAHKDKLDDKDIQLIKYLLENKHTSPFEHCQMTFRFSTPLFVRSQHMRHRTWKFNEISRRYTSSDIEFYLPKEFRKQHENNRQASTNELFDPEMNGWYYYGERMVECETNIDAEISLNNVVWEFHRFSLALYNKMIQMGVCREQARGVLPQNMYTEYYGTIDLHNALNFLELRLHEGAQWEIQQVALAMKEIMEELYPNVMKCYKEIITTNKI